MLKVLAKAHDVILKKGKPFTFKKEFQTHSQFSIHCSTVQVVRTPLSQNEVPVSGSF